MKNRKAGALMWIIILVILIIVGIILFLMFYEKENPINFSSLTLNLGKSEIHELKNFEGLANVLVVKGNPQIFLKKSS